MDVHQLTAKQQEELIEDLLALKDVVPTEESCPPEEEEDFCVALMGIKGFDHRTKVKARSERQNLQTASQLCTKQVGTGEINQIIESLLKVKVQRITKTY